jgi:hypothetical protein
MRWISVILTASLLIGLYMQTSDFPRPEDAAAFHRRAYRLIDAVPFRLGDWEGVTVDVPPAAQKLLRPNKLLSRSYRNASTGKTASLIIVQCLDSRDMSGHYPPNCYPAHGWERSCADTSVRIRIDDRVLNVMRYEFEQAAFDHNRHIVAYNFFVLPGTGPAADMKAVRAAAANYRLRHFGAAEFQVVLEAGDVVGDVTEEKAAFSQLIQPLMPLLEPLSSTETNPAEDRSVLEAAGPVKP